MRFLLSSHDFEFNNNNSMLAHGMLFCYYITYMNASQLKIKLYRYVVCCSATNPMLMRGWISGRFVKLLSLIFFFILREGNHPDDFSRITYKKLLQEVCRFANVLKSHGVRKGDTVSIYMPMVLELPIAMLACSRIGAIHSIVVRMRKIV